MQTSLVSFLHVYCSAFTGRYAVNIFFVLLTCISFLGCTEVAKSVPGFV